MATPRLLTFSEQASVLARHPVTAARVAATKAAILAGLYDWTYYDYAYQPYVWAVKFPGIIEPIGEQIDDSVYGLVTIQPAPAGEIYFSGFSPVALPDAPTEGPGSYKPPPHDRGFFDDLVSTLWLVALAGGAIYLFSRTSKV